IIKACGKTFSPVFYGLTPDVTPFVNQVMQSKPDLVLMDSISAQVVQFAKAFQQNGLPASKLLSPDTDFAYSTILKTAGSSMDGAYSLGSFKGWGLTNDPEVAAYLKAMKASSSVDPRSGTVEWGYSMVMFLAAAAKQIGYSKFNSASLAKFMNTANH